MAGEWQWQQKMNYHCRLSIAAEQDSFMDKLTTTIKREWLREIVAGRKRVEYRKLKPYWECPDSC